MPETRICAACQATRLSVYNKTALCSSCEREVLSAGYLAGGDDGQPVPVWVWGTAPARRMLARLELGRAFEVFRVAAGLSRAKAGQIAGWSAATIGMIENGTRDTIFDIRNLLHLMDAFGVPRAMLLPAVLGQAGAFPDRRAALSEAGRNGRPSGDYKPGEIMHIIAGKLRARGLEITERTCGDEVTDLTVTCPGHPGKGTVHVSYDGYVAWECLTEITGEVAEMVTGLLSHQTLAGEPGDSDSVVPGNRRPLGGSGGRLVSAGGAARGRLDGPCHGER